MQITYTGNNHYDWVDLTIEKGSTTIETTLHSQEDMEDNIQMLMEGVSELTNHQNYSYQDLEDLVRKHGMTEEVDAKLELLQGAVQDLLEKCTVPKGDEYLIQNVEEYLE